MATWTSNETSADVDEQRDVRVAEHAALIVGLAEQAQDLVAADLGAAAAVGGGVDVLGRD
jgi:hypothetical protein